MSSLRTALVGLCCAAAAQACVHIPRPDAGGDASAEASPDVTAMDAMAEASMDSGMDASIEASAEASVDMDAEASVEASAEASVEPTVEAGSEAGDAADARTCTMGQSLCGTSCVDTMTSAMNCGMCGRVCTGGTLCSSGVCQCPMGSVDCGGTCTNIGSDRLNCGVCGNACPAGVGCMGGTCQCPAGMTTVCAGACTDTQTNALHCGTCGNACPMGQSCVAGSCRCPGASTLCGGSCVDTSSNDSHCGMCGNACMSPLRCTTGSCRCPIAGQTLCAGACVDTQVSNSHCGMCGNACTGGQSCVMGTCQCPAGQQLCGGSCVNTAVSNSHCGACNNACSGGRTCQSSTCRCVFPQNDCGGSTCLDLSTDVNNCGGCGTVCTPPTGMVASCSGGCSYSCRAGLGDCDGNSANGCEVDLSNTRDNCGMCGTFCDGTCSAGACSEWLRALIERNGGLFPRSIGVDGDGNIYVAGTFGVSVVVAPGRTFNAMGSSGAYLASYTPAGTLRWARQIESAGGDWLNSIAVRGSGANVVVAIAGGTAANIDFGAGPVSATTSSRGFAAAYRNDGTLRWAQMWASDGGPSVIDMARGVAISPVNGDVIVSSTFYRTLTGSGWSAAGATAPSNIALVRFSSAGAPVAPMKVLNVLAGGTLLSRALAFDGGGNVCVTAMLSGQFEEGGMTFGAVGSSADIMVGCYDSAGTRRWANVIGSAGTQDPTAIYVDEVNGNVTIGGTFANTVNFGTASLTASGTSDSFVAQFGITGTNRWATQIGSINGSEALASLVVGSTGELYAFGHTQGNFTVGASMLATGFGQSTYIAALNLNAGTALRGYALSGIGTEYAQGMSTCGAGFLCMVGMYGGSSLSLRSATLPQPPVAYDGFFGRLSQTL